MGVLKTGPSQSSGFVGNSRLISGAINIQWVAWMEASAIAAMRIYGHQDFRSALDEGFFLCKQHSQRLGGNEFLVGVS